MSTKSKQFEDEVRALLNSQGFITKSEIQLEHKRVDVYAERHEWNVLRRYAIECKDWGSVMGATDLNQILTDYGDLYRANLIDWVMIVTRNGLAPAAQARMQNSRTAVHLTIRELRNSIIDFSPYLKSIISDYERDGLPTFYVPAIAATAGSESTDFEGMIDAWIDDGAKPPIAVLAGYGAGKTTFARHVAYTFAQKCQDTEARIPILIPLGELCHQQTIDGLLGYMFASKYVVKGYNFGLFQQLNESGRFLIILDGFDEMKHAMTKEIFRFTFKELLRLNTPKTKMILSGRPTAFLNEDERLEFLEATMVASGLRIPLLGRPQFHQVELAPFGEHQIRSFIQKYARYVKAEFGKTNDELPTEEDFLEFESIRELASRPVQLRMLFELLPNYNGDLNKLTVRDLYAFFLELLIRREAEKPARKRFAAERRHEFIQSLAAFMWLNGMTVITLEAIRISAFCTEYELSECGSSDEARRDLCSGAFVEMRYPENLFFPHRSIHEFLVATWCVSTLQSAMGKDPVFRAFGENYSLSTVFEMLSPEIVDFMIALIGDTERRFFILLMSKVDSSFKMDTLRLVTSSPLMMKEVGAQAMSGDLSAYAIYICGVNFASWSPRTEGHPDPVEIGFRLLEPSPEKDKRYVYRAIMLLWHAISQHQESQSRDGRILEMTRLICSYQVPIWKKKKKDSDGNSIPDYVTPNFVKGLFKCLVIDETGGALRLEDLSKELLRERAIGASEWWSLDGQARLASRCRVASQEAVKLRALIANRIRR